VRWEDCLAHGWVFYGGPGSVLTPENTLVQWGGGEVWARKRVGETFLEKRHTTLDQLFADIGSWEAEQASRRTEEA